MVRRSRYRLAAATALLLALLLARCAVAPAPQATDGQSIEVCGQPFPVGTRVVSWREPGGYDAYRTAKFFTPEPEPDGRRRYAVRGNLPEAIAARAREHGLSLADLQQVVHQFVIHYDVAGTSRQCFKILQDVRYLSVHFLLDVDGTIYQTLDLREKGQHATIANDFSVGVEIAHPGVFKQPLSADMRRWYEQDEDGWRMRLPAWMTETGVRTPDFVARPDRPDFVSGEVQGVLYHQFDFTSEQYAALARLCAALASVFPRIRLEVPRDADGSVVNHVLPEAELRAFDGIVGHFHVQLNKQDPGPAFQWDRLLHEARALRGQ
ncbi:MAG: peptidoglycan recognition family protein [Planctomycetota bacterium]